MNFIFGKTKITVSFLLAAGLCAAALLPGRLLPLLFVAVAVHEGGHFIWLILQKKKVEHIMLSLTGVRVRLQNGTKMSESGELLLNLCGPAANLLLGGTVLVCGRSVQSMRIAAVNFAIAAATLLPLGESDGAMITDILLERCLVRLPERERKWLRRGIGAVLVMSFLAVGRAFS